MYNLQTTLFLAAVSTSTQWNSLWVSRKTHKRTNSLHFLQPVRYNFVLEDLLMTVSSRVHQQRKINHTHTHKMNARTGPHSAEKKEDDAKKEKG